jgi:hypothetical protein
MDANKHAWKKPELTVLVRSRPEEAVLAGCKTLGQSGPVKNHCNAATGSGDCQANTPS